MTLPLQLISAIALGWHSSSASHLVHRKIQKSKDAATVKSSNNSKKRGRRATAEFMVKIDAVTEIS